MATLQTLPQNLCRCWLRSRRTSSNLAGVDIWLRERVDVRAMSGMPINFLPGYNKAPIRMSDLRNSADGFVFNIKDEYLIKNQFTPSYSKKS
jgi:hypothetical protein